MNPDQLPLIDTHQHLWDLAKFRLPWLPADGPLAGSHTLADYEREAQGLAIVKTVYMEVDVASEQRPDEAAYVLDLCRRDDNVMAGAVIGGDPAGDGFADYVARFAADPHLKGVRQVLHGGLPRGYCLGDAFVRGVRSLGEKNLCFDLCLRPGELSDGAKLAELCPDTRFVLDHCGNAPVQTNDRSEWERDIARVAERPNVVCKISGIVAGARTGAWTPDDLAPVIAHVADVFGPDRLVFGGDWPVCTATATLRGWIEALLEITESWPQHNRRKLLHDNAVAFYDLG